MGEIVIKIYQKIILSFIIVTCFIFVVGVTGAMNMKKINEASESMYKDNLFSINQLQSIETDIHKITALMLTLVNKDNRGQISDLEARIKMANENIDKNMEEYDQHTLSVDQYQLYEKVKSEFVKFRELEKELISHIDVDQYENATFVLGSIQVTRKNLEDYLKEAVEINIDVAAHVNLNNQNTYAASNTIMIIISTAGLLFSILLGVFLSRTIYNKLKQIRIFVQALGEGDLTQTITVKTKDEIGELSTALNAACNNIKELISKVIVTSQDMNSQSEELSAVTEEIASKMDTINNSYDQIAEMIQDLSAATEEISSSTQNIEITTGDLTDKADKAKISSEEIKRRAINIKNKGYEKKEITISKSKEKKNKINDAIIAGKVVEHIGAMAGAIGSIANQTNLLSLNAAIEAARAGEQGKGFTVVAEEVKKLSEEAAKSVNGIKELISEVKNAFEKLSVTSEELVDFLNNSVEPDCELLVETGISYEKDSAVVNDFSKEILKAVKTMNVSISQLNQIIGSVTVSAEQTAAGSQEVTGSIKEITNAMEEIAKSAQNQALLAENLNAVVGNFKI